MTEMDLVQLLVAKLLAQGCPSERIVHEFVLEGEDRRYAADVVVMGLDGRTPVAIFELKNRFSQEVVSGAVRQLTKFTSMVPISVRAYVVVPALDKSCAIVASVDNVLRGEANVDDVCSALHSGGDPLPPYQVLVTGFQSKMAVASGELRLKRIDNFKELTRWLGILIGVVFLIDFILDGWVLDWQNVAVLALAAVVVSLPYYDLISVKDVSLRRVKNEADDK